MIGRAPKLGISLVHGQLSVTVRDAAGSERTRTASSSVNTAAQLGPALDALWTQLGGFTGENVSFVFASLHCSLLAIRHPPMSTKELRLFLGRKAQAEWKTPNSAPLWSYSSVARLGKGEPTALLHLAPAEIIEALAVWCRKRNLQPHMALSTPAAAFALLQERDAEGVHMVLVDAGESTIIAVGKNDGSPLLVRELARSWTEDDSDTPERLAREAQRTILFSRQQMGGATQSITLYGTGAARLVSAMAETTELPVEALDETISWSSLALRRNQATENLFPAQVLGHMRRRRMALFLLIFSSIFALSCLGTMIGMELQHQRLEQQIQTLSLPTQMAILAKERARLEAQKQKVEHNHALHAAMQQRTPPPLPAWMAGFAADALPNGLAWSKVRVAFDTATFTWHAAIQGTAPRDPLQSAHLLERYQDLLSSQRTGLRIHTPWRGSWIQALRAGGTWEAETLRKRFLIEGELQ